MGWWESLVLLNFQDLWLSLSEYSKKYKKNFSRFFSISVQLGQGIASHTRDVTLQREVISALLENPHIPLTLLETPYILLTLLKNSI